MRPGEHRARQRPAAPEPDIAALLALYREPSAGPVLDDTQARLRRATYHLARNRPDLSAHQRLWTSQLATVLIVIGLAIGAALAAPGLARTIVFAVLTIPFALVVMWRISALLLVVVTPIEPRRRSVKRLATSALPVYSVLVPLVHEAHVVPGLIAAIDRLDYPRDRLDVILILEAADHATVRAVERQQLPAGFRVVVVPDGAPRTKPKALAYALEDARGDYVVVYDAEDTPEPQQLRRAAAAFAAGPADLACLQARLDIDPAQRGWLARHFTLEYAALFHGLLPVLAAWRMPVPLGGTSNHFKRSVLVDAGGWDPFNVTEDADLGIRLARLGCNVGVLSSSTGEEAPDRLDVWLKQRTRWIKGYMQTYAVHMRSPRTTLRQLGLGGFLSFQVTVGGLILSALVHPWVYVLIAIDVWQDGLLAASDDAIGAMIDAIAIATLAGGVFGAVALAAVAGARRGCHPSLLMLVTMPVYWLLASWAAYRALYHLMRKPHLWEKTPHAARPDPRRAPALR